MTHTYSITGMSCSGCQATVQKLLSAVAGIKSASVDLKKSEVVIDMENHIPITQLQSALKDHSRYQIIEKQKYHNGTAHAGDTKPVVVNSSNDNGQYFCPMHCEGDKTYNKPGDCPVCGMHLEKIPSVQKKLQYTCPMHSEIIKDAPGSCPICGMALVPMQPVDG